jgi:hypothetical protein
MHESDSENAPRPNRHSTTSAASWATPMDSKLGRSSAFVVLWTTRPLSERLRRLGFSSTASAFRGQRARERGVSQPFSAAVGARRINWKCQADPTSSESNSPVPSEAESRVAPSNAPVRVRFINTPSGLDLETFAPPGSIILGVADELGLRIPRGCTSGVCGACTCDMVHQALPGGRQTVRVCSTRVATFPGIDEIVIDVYRMKENATREAMQGAAPTALSRFDNIDFEYKAGAPPQVILSPTNPFTRQRTVRCEKCKGSGKHLCEACQGSGLSRPDLMCYICVGLRRTRCAECQGTGYRTLRR